MERLATERLLRWRRRAQRKPLLIDGARQVGKTWLVERLFGARHFPATHKLDFLAEPGLAGIFDDGLEPGRILSNLEILRKTSINPEAELIFFDEVGECQPAVDSLKYFAEEMPGAFVCATGANIGLLGSFPVGKVELLELFPLCFEEYLMAAGDRRLLECFHARSAAKAAHDSLWSLLLDYYYTGGMPEAVHCWFHDGGSVQRRCERVQAIHRDLLAGYQRDFGKYSGKVDARHIESVFLNIPRQLAKAMDGSVKRFHFKGVIDRKKRYADLRDPISWLERAKLAAKCLQLDCRPTAPLDALARENIFKLFLFDVGLLGFLLNMDYAEQRGQKTWYKGFIAENFVQNELRAQVRYPTYCWATARGEIEFLHKCRGGAIIPVEVKSGRRTRARSLHSYIERYAPDKTVKLVGGPGRPDGDGRHLAWPLYCAQFLREL